MEFPDDAERSQVSNGSHRGEAERGIVGSGRIGKGGSTKYDPISRTRDNPDEHCRGIKGHEDRAAKVVETMNEKQFTTELDALMGQIATLQKTIAAPRDRDSVLPDTGGSEVVSLRARLRRAETALIEAKTFVGKDKLRVRVPWNLCVVVMDGGDKVTLADAPFAETVQFCKQFSKFDILLNVIETKVPHEYNSHGFMLTAEIPQAYRDSLPVAHSYIFLYKTGKIPVPQYGSTLGPDRGIKSGGKWRSVAFIPWDSTGYVARPFEGFKTQRGQIGTHETLNTINCMTAIAPYFCTPMRLDNPDNLPSYEYEARKVGTLTDADYAKLLADPTWTI